jgi:uncharacterized protein (DUF2132 family)
MDKKGSENINPREQPNNHLHGVKLIDMLEFLVAKYGWEELEKRTDIRIFGNNPSIKSSVNFLRRTPWAREKVEGMFLYCMRKTKGRK